MSTPSSSSPSQYESYISTSPTPPFKYTRPSPNSIAFATIPAVDVSRAQKFYASVFNWIFWTPGGSGVTIFNTGGDVMGRMRKVEDLSATRDDGVVLYVLVESVDIALGRVADFGGTVVKEKWVEGGHTELGEFRDTEGNLMGVMRWVI